MLALDRTARLDAHIIDAGFKGYANEKTLAKFVAKFERDLVQTGYDRNLEVRRIAGGKHEGRLVAILVLGPREPATFEAMSFAHLGLPVFQYC